MRTIKRQSEKGGWLNSGIWTVDPQNAKTYPTAVDNYDLTKVGPATQYPKVPYGIFDEMCSKEFDLLGTGTFMSHIAAAASNDVIENLLSGNATYK